MAVDTTIVKLLAMECCRNKSNIKQPGLSDAADNAQSIPFACSARAILHGHGRINA